MFLLEKCLFFEITEYVVNNTIFSSKDEKIICKSLLYCLNVERYHLKHFKVDLYNNIFTKQEIKDKCLEIFSKAQFHFNNFKKLIKQYKYKKIPLINDLDFLSLSKIDIDYNICTIVDKEVKYCFKITDLIKIINNSLLSKIDYFYPDAKEIKNPYNNLPFDNSTLYNIYFNIKSSNIIMPVLFHLYMLEGFDLKNFQNNHETLLRDMLIKSYINSMGDNKFIMQMKKMFNDARTIGITNKKRFKLIHPSIKGAELIKIFKPFVKTYLNVVYTLNVSKKVTLKNELYKKITAFFVENPKFGRRFQSKHNLFVFGIDRVIIDYNLQVKNKYHSIDIQNVSLPSLTEWASNRYGPPVPPLDLLPNANLLPNDRLIESNIQWRAPVGVEGEGEVDRHDDSEDDEDDEDDMPMLIPDIGSDNESGDNRDHEYELFVRALTNNGE